MKFFFDNDIPDKIARAFCELGKDIAHESDEIFDDDEPDDRGQPVEGIWIPMIAKRGWVAVPGNFGTYLKARSSGALAAHPFVGFFVGKGFDNLSNWNRFDRPVRVWPVLEETAARAAKGAYYKITVHGKLEKL